MVQNHDINSPNGTMDIGNISQDNSLFSNNSNPVFVFNQASQAREHTISLNMYYVHLLGQQRHV